MINKIYWVSMTGLIAISLMLIVDTFVQTFISYDRGLSFLVFVVGLLLGLTALISSGVIEERRYRAADEAVVRSFAALSLANLDEAVRNDAKQPTSDEKTSPSLQQLESAEANLAKLTPSNDKLLVLAEKNPPPQQWFDAADSRPDVPEKPSDRELT